MVLTPGTPGFAGLACSALQSVPVDPVPSPVVSPSYRRALAAVAIVPVGAALTWYLFTRPERSPPPRIRSAMLSNWPIVVSDGSDSWLVAARPPQALVNLLVEDVKRRAARPVVAIPDPALSLVLRTEFEEGLQGVYGTDSVLRIAREAGVDRGAFAATCLAHRSVNGDDLYYVPFTSAAFNQMRIDLVPPQPEHAGVGVYEPSTLSPILRIATTSGSLDRWDQVPLDPGSDCEADLVVVLE
jgi:hypothetical protein